MDNPYKRWDRGDRTILVVLIAFLFLFGVLFFGFYLQRGRPKVGQREFTIGPECGPLPTGDIDDMVADEGVCKNLCRARCQSSDLRFKSSSIRVHEQTGCNICDCFCR